MRRRIFTTLSALSLVLCLASVALWVRSYWIEDILLHKGNLWVIAVSSEQGGLGFGMTHLQKPLPPGWYGDGWVHASSMTYLYDHSSALVPVIGITIPSWFTLGVSAILPVQWFRTWRRDRSAERKGLCMTCGYDLRASKERCPECGTAIPPGFAGCSEPKVM